MEINPKKRYCRINNYKKRSRNKGKPMGTEVSDEAKFKLDRFISDVRKYSECVKKEEKKAQYLKRKKSSKPEHKIDTSLRKGIFGNGIIGDEVYPSVKDILRQNKKKRNNSFKNVTTDSQNDIHSFCDDSSIENGSPTQDNRHVSPREKVLEKSSQPNEQCENKKAEAKTSECPCKHVPNTFFGQYSNMTKTLLENCKNKEIEQKIKEIHLKYFLSLANPNITDEETTKILKTIEKSGLTLFLLPTSTGNEETSFRTREKEENICKENQNILRNLNSSPGKQKKNIDSSEKFISDFPGILYSPSKCEIPSGFRTPPSRLSELPFSPEGRKEASRNYHAGISPKNELFMNPLKSFGVKPIKRSPVRPSVSDTTARLTARADQLLNSPVKVRSPISRMPSSPDIIYPSPEINRKFNYIASPKLNFVPTPMNCQNRFPEPSRLVPDRRPFSQPEPINFPMENQKAVRDSFPLKDISSHELNVPHLKTSLNRCKLISGRESSTMNQFWEFPSKKSMQCGPSKQSSVTLSPPMNIHHLNSYCQPKQQPYSSTIFQDTSSFSTGVDCGQKNLYIPPVKFSPHTF